jgi:hypothetical protein
VTSEWRPTYRGDGRSLKVESGGKTIWAGLIDSEVPSGETSKINALTAERMLEDMPLPWATPGRDRASNPVGFDYWWRMLHYGAEPPNPYTVSPLTGSLSSEEQGRATRFVEMAAHLAASTLLNSNAGVTVRSKQAGAYSGHDTTFLGKDIEIGFSTLLRHLDDERENASYQKVHNALWHVCAAATDPAAPVRRDTLHLWGKKVKLIHRKSADQLVRDRLVRDEGIKAFAYDEEYMPRRLIDMYQYGDLVHWAEFKEAVQPQEAPFSADWQRESFFRAAAGVAHMYIGFAELVKAITLD